LDCWNEFRVLRPNIQKFKLLFDALEIKTVKYSAMVSYVVKFPRA